MLNGEVCYLRPLKIEDAEHINEWNQNQAITKYLADGYNPVSIDIHKQQIGKLIDTSGFSTFKRYMIVENMSGLDNPVGVITLSRIDWISKNAIIGLYIGDDKYHGKGIAKEAVTLLEQFAKQYLAMRKLCLFVVDDNIAGVKFWNKMDYTKVGAFTKDAFIDGEYCDVNIMEKFL